MNKFYLIESEDVSPNDRDSTGAIKGDTRIISISTAPEETNMSHEERTEGWLGTTNDICVTAHGEFDTLDLARESAHKMGFTEKYDDPNQIDDYIETTVVEEWVTPEAVMEKWDAGDWFDGLGRSGTIAEYCITDKTTDDEIAIIAKKCETEAAAEKQLIFGCDEYLTELRDELIEENE